jgi:hypothetical protein
VRRHICHKGGGEEGEDSFKDQNSRPLRSVDLGIKIMLIL